MTEHTPGPWEWYPWQNPGHKGITVGYQNPHSNLTRVVAELDADDVANARLIAAAPDLLAAARLMYEQCVVQGMSEGEDAMVREAIRKATGEE